MLGLAECLERKGLLFDEAARDIASGKASPRAADPVARVEQLRTSATALDGVDPALRDHAREARGRRDALNGAMRVCALQVAPRASVSYAGELIEAIRADARLLGEAGPAARDHHPRTSALPPARSNLVNLELATRVHVSTILHEVGRDEVAARHLDEAIALEPDRAECTAAGPSCARISAQPDKAIATSTASCGSRSRPTSTPTSSAPGVCGRSARRQCAAPTRDRQRDADRVLGAESRYGSGRAAWCRPGPARRAQVFPSGLRAVCSRSGLRLPRSASGAHRSGRPRRPRVGIGRAVGQSCLTSPRVRMGAALISTTTSPARNPRRLAIVPG